MESAQVAVTYDMIGGLDAAKTALREAITYPLKYPALYEEGVAREACKGVLLFGPPGTGKTRIARQIGKVLNAREPKIVNGPEVLDKYVGASEEKIRELFADAEEEQSHPICSRILLRQDGVTDLELQQLTRA